MSSLIYENVWTDKAKYDDAERQYYERLTKASLTPLADEVAKARQRLIAVKGAYEDLPVECPRPVADTNVKMFEARFGQFEKTILSLLQKIEQLELRVSSIEKLPAFSVANKSPETPKSTPNEAPVDDDNDDGVDLFASDSDEESEAVAKIREERLAAYNAKKSKKPVLIAKSNVILDVKPWDDETDMTLMEAEVRKITADGLLWGAAKLVPLAYGIRKLQISCVVEDDKVSIDSLQEQIEALEDCVQSVDIAAFNKI